MKKIIIMTLIAIAVFSLEILYVSIKLEQKLSYLEVHQKTITLQINNLDNSILSIGNTTQFLKNRSNYPYNYLTSKPFQATTMFAEK